MGRNIDAFSLTANCGTIANLGAQQSCGEAGGAQPDKSVVACDHPSGFGSFIECAMIYACLLICR